MLSNKIFPFIFRLQGLRPNQRGLTYLVSCSFSKTHYEVLGVSRSANADQIKAAYYKLAKEYHPDVNPAGAEKFKAVNLAHQILCDSFKKREYDETLGSSSRSYYSNESSYQSQRHTSTAYSAAYGSNAGYYYSNTHDWGDNNQGSYNNRRSQEQADEETFRYAQNIERKMDEFVQAFRRKMVVIAIASLVISFILHTASEAYTLTKSSHYHEEKTQVRAQEPPKDKVQQKPAIDYEREIRETHNKYLISQSSKDEKAAHEIKYEHKLTMGAHEKVRTRGGIPHTIVEKKLLYDSEGVRIRGRRAKSLYD